MSVFDHQFLVLRTEARHSSSLGRVLDLRLGLQALPILTFESFPGCHCSPVDFRTQREAAMAILVISRSRLVDTET